jgi:NAD(P)H-quinone oxidoreductase subunit 5
MPESHLLYALLIGTLCLALPLAPVVGTVATRAVFGALIVSAGAGLIAGVHGTWLPLAIPMGGHEAAVGFGVLLDRLSLLLVAFVAALGLVVHGYAARYLIGEAGRERFLGGIALVVGAACLQALSPGLAQFALAWLLMSAGIHRLLLHDPLRQAARAAAAVKFAVSRIGDVAMAGAIVALLAGTGSTAFGATPVAGPALLIACLCLVLATVCKMALVPGQQWLIGTIEAPTPLSALMHAGAINAAGFLLVRCGGWFAAAPPAGDLLLLAGLVSAVAGPLAMWCQSDLKRSLAWSTVGQMGFTVVQIALGAPAAAILHLLGHGCYKANAFLRSGTVTAMVETRPVPPTVGLALLAWAGGSLVAFAVLAASYTALAGNPAQLPGGWALVTVQALALGQVLGSPTSSTYAWPLRLLVLVPVALLYAGLVWAVESLFAGVLPPMPTAPAYLVWAAPIALGALGAFWAVLPALTASPLLRSLRVHAANGFYLQHLLSRSRA